MELFLAGIDQSVAPLEVREPLAVARADVPDVLRRLMAEGWAQEALLVATCNRTELYVVSPEPDAGERTLSFF
ncbi:MAG: glutamyl-tRNA reductase, partial [Planctomycetota bacterium]